MAVFPDNILHQAVTGLESFPLSQSLHGLVGSRRRGGADLDTWTPGRLDAWTPGRLDAKTIMALGLGILTALNPALALLFQIAHDRRKALTGTGAVFVVIHLVYGRSCLCATACI